MPTAPPKKTTEMTTTATTAGENELVVVRSVVGEARGFNLTNIGASSFPRNSSAISTAIPVKVDDDVLMPWEPSLSTKISVNSFKHLLDLCKQSGQNSQCSFLAVSIVKQASKQASSVLVNFWTSNTDWNYGSSLKRSWEEVTLERSRRGLLASVCTGSGRKKNMRHV